MPKRDDEIDFGEDPLGPGGEDPEPENPEDKGPSPEEVRRRLLKNQPSSGKGNRRNRNGNSGSRATMGLMSYVINIIFALLLAIGVVFYLSPSKSDVRDIQTKFDAFNASTQASVANFSTTYATQQSVSDVAGDVQTLKDWKRDLVIPTVPDYSSFYSSSSSFSSGGNASGNLSGTVPEMFNGLWTRWWNLNNSFAVLNASFQAAQVHVPYLTLITGDCVVTAGLPINTSVTKGKSVTYTLPASTVLNISANASPNTFGYWLVNGAIVPNSSTAITITGDTIVQAYLATGSSPVSTPVPVTCPVPAVPILTYPANGATVSASGVSFFWNSCANASSYELWVTGYPVVATNSTGLVWTGSLGSNTSYTWKVVARSSCGLSSDSLNWTFNTSP